MKMNVLGQQSSSTWSLAAEEEAKRAWDRYEIWYLRNMLYITMFYMRSNLKHIK